MNSFQKIVLIIAVVTLIVLLIFIGIILRNNKSTQSWPPVTGDCPDYWVDTSGNGGNCINVKNLGTCSSNMNFSNPTFTGSNGNCSKYQWATNCGVTWDGITYGLINNPCDTAKPSST
jgi:hypothetical protein